MTLRSPRLPGATATTATYRDPEDRVVSVDRAQVRRDLLVVLTHGPLWKWQLREALHLDEAIVYRELQVLREAGQVKAIGKRMAERKWALIGYQGPSSDPIVNASTVIAAKKPAPAKDSWWTRDLTREAFQERARRGADGG